MAANEGSVYVPQDGKSFEITDKDVVRFTCPAEGSTGYKTTVKVTEGEAKVMEGRPVYMVVKGKPITTGGGAPEFDVKPTAGKTGKVKVTVTKTPPGDGKPEVTEYEFEVK